MRVEADELLLWLEKNSEEMAQCRTSIMLGRAWLGKLLGTMGEPNPYTNDGARETTEDIEPATDKAEEDLVFTGSRVSRIDQMREFIKNHFIYVIEHQAPTKTSRQVQYATNAHTHFSEARFWLGYELERLKNEDD